ncbi:S8 family serine peptidase [Parafilimonas terrae]|uniref:Por secretion system C-terminal sorting domain-containing protein n=1 Tax=Parafilimonas terrae TaxID=1465490 RepID=A0A1I5RDA2_9BACT|nr:S8 family serine peptidase [Parafilimonas terrae]SFP56524.1 Por secretion system C-terminal sorting domain-containing protein [Parafilimonas terrae]
MRKNLPILLKIKGRKNIFKYILPLIVVLFSVRLSAQDLKPQAIQQIKLLTEEKASRTPAQKKIDSRLLLAYKMQNNPAFAKQLPAYKTDVKANSQGKVKVDIEAHVSQQLLSDLKNLGADIIFSSERFNNIVANVPLDKVEQIAGYKAVLHINQWLAPTHNDPHINNNVANSRAGKKITGNNSPGIKNRADFATRAATVRNELNNVFNSGANNNFGGSVTSEADATHKAALARTTFGVSGAGVKIGVLSDGIDGYETSQATGDLPAVLNILPGQAGSGREGRAMLELIHDIAPDADLYFATAFISQASFAQNILDLRTAGCDIIVDDVTYYAEGVFQNDNVAQSVNTVTSSGALYFSSAGNSGNVNDGTAGVWEGDFTDGGSLPLFPGTVNDFGGGVLYNTVTGTTGLVTLKWSDPLAHSSNDYDLYATDPAGTAVIDFSTNVQDGDDNAYEYLHYGFPAGYRFYIVKNTGAETRALHLNTNRGRLQNATPGVMYGHNAAGSAYTVAATPAAIPFYSNFPQGPYPDPFNATNLVEGFSSDGPRRIFYNPDGSEITAGNVLFGTNGGTLLQKPDITAADGCSTTTPGFETFYGTSAAAPNAAAIAALVKSAFPALTPAQIRTALISSAIDIETPGADRDAGAGIIMAYEALEAAGAPSGLSISIADKSVKEGNNGYKLVNFIVTLSNKPSKKVAVRYVVKPGSATPGSDYLAESGILVFPKNGAQTQRIPVLIKGDKVNEADETFKVILRNAVNAIISNGEATGTIINDDGTAIAASGSDDAASSAFITGNGIKLSPNPAINSTNISLNGYTGNVTILVSDMKGKVLQQKKVQLQSAKSGLQSFDVSAYAAGTYLVTVIDEKGNKHTQKLIIAR